MRQACDDALGLALTLSTQYIQAIRLWKDTVILVIRLEVICLLYDNHIAAFQTLYLSESSLF